MDVTRSVVEVLVCCDYALGMAFGRATLGPVNHGVRTRFIWSDPRDDHTFPHIISLGDVNLTRDKNTTEAL